MRRDFVEACMARCMRPREIYRAIESHPSLSLPGFSTFEADMSQIRARWVREASEDRDAKRSELRMALRYVYRTAVTQVRVANRSGLLRIEPSPDLTSALRALNQLALLDGLNDRGISGDSSRPLQGLSGVLARIAEAQADPAPQKPTP